MREREDGWGLIISLLNVFQAKENDGYAFVNREREKGEATFDQCNSGMAGFRFWRKDGEK